MKRDPQTSYAVTLMLHDDVGEVWSLTLSSDCLGFIGSYKRLDGFDIHAALRVEGIDRTA